MHGNFTYIGIAVIVAVILGVTIYHFLRNRKINANGIEVSATVSRIKAVQSRDSEGFPTEETVYYVTYMGEDGRSAEAVLGNPPRDLTEGTRLRVRYLPEKPKFVLAVKE